MLEGAKKTRFIKRLHVEFPGCVVIKNDPNYIQGIPDITVLYGTKWAMLEYKTSRNARVQPNQNFYIQQFYKMSYAAFVYPENEEDVIRDLHRAFKPRRKAFVPKP